MKGVTMIGVSRAQTADAALTFVELTWHKQRIENRLRFGRQVGQQVLDRHRRVVRVWVPISHGWREDHGWRMPPPKPG